MEAPNLISKLSNEILFAIASYLTSSRDLQTFALLDKRFNACIQPLLWNSVLFDVDTTGIFPRPEVRGHNSGIEPRRLELPSGISEQNAIWIKKIKLQDRREMAQRTLSWSMKPVIRQCPNIEYMDLDLPLRGFEIEGELPEIKQIRLSEEDVNNWGSTLVAIPDETLKKLFNAQSLRHVEFYMDCQALSRIGLDERTLPATHLTINRCPVFHADAICTFIQACKALEEVHVKYNFPLSESPELNLHEDHDKFREACGFHCETLHTISITRERYGEQDPNHHSDDIGICLGGIPFDEFDALTHLSINISQLYCYGLVQTMPPSLEILQLQIPADNRKSTRYDIRRAQTLKVFDQILESRIEFPELRQIVWWYNFTNLGDDDDSDDNEDILESSEAKTSRIVDRCIFDSQVSRFAEEDIDLVWLETESIDETSFGIASPHINWRKGGLLTTAEDREALQQEVDDG